MPAHRSQRPPMTALHSTLHDLLDRNRAFALAARGTTNHLPMALIALQRMGASDFRLLEYFAWWETHKALPHAPALLFAQAGDDPRDTQDWLALRGEARAFEALSRRFEAWMKRDGAAPVATAVWQRLDGSVATNAFHALIRLAYGLEAGHRGEAAAGLAALVVAHLELGLRLDALESAPSVPAALDRIHRAMEGAVFAGGAITGALKRAAADPRLQAALSVPALHTSQRLRAMAQAAIALYAQTQDFTVLHLVTMLHAARVLLQRCPGLDTPRQHLALWSAFCTAYAAVGSPRLMAVEAPDEVLDWPQIFAAAVAHQDDHVIKLSHSCHEEFRHYGNPLYQQVASELVMGVPA
jgi:hypothetical protein